MRVMITLVVSDRLVNDRQNDSSLAGISSIVPKPAAGLCFLEEPLDFRLYKRRG